MSVLDIKCNCSSDRKVLRPAVSHVCDTRVTSLKDAAALTFIASLVGGAGLFGLMMVEILLALRPWLQSLSIFMMMKERARRR